MEKEKVASFLNDIKSVCEKYRLSISHEDTHGAFSIKDYDEDTMEWLMDADYGDW